MLAEQAQGLEGDLMRHVADLVLGAEQVVADRLLLRLDPFDDRVGAANVGEPFVLPELVGLHGLREHAAALDGPSPGPRPALGSFVLAPKPEWRDLAALGRVMDETGVGLGVIIPPASLIERLRPTGAGATERYNQSMSEELARAEGRFWAAAIVDPLGGAGEVAQLERSLALPHIAAVGLVTSYDGRVLDFPAFAPILEAARAHDVPVLVHPAQVPPPARQALRLEHPVLTASFGFLMEDALTIIRMALNGIF